MTGYMHPLYAESLAEFGTPVELPRCGGWILRRPISGFSCSDAMGCYPLFACRDWTQLHSDLEDLKHELVSLALVADPFRAYDLAYLHRCFDLVIPFKEHFVTDLCQPMDIIISKHHRKRARQALRNVHVEQCPDPAQLLSQWVNLYGSLIEKHNLKGIKALSKKAFAKQLDVPGIVMFGAIYQGTMIGADLWYVQGEVAYGHLAALSPDGYRMAASYALLWSAIEYFLDKVRWIHLGAGAGIEGNGTDSLSVFKRGWSTGTRTAYFCGRVFDHERYSELVEAKGIASTDYFPAYRSGEFR